MNILKDAQDNWPEDEARATARAYFGRIGDGYTVAENVELLRKDVAHMTKVFMEQADGEELVARYLSTLEAQIKEKIATTDKR